MRHPIVFRSLVVVAASLAWSGAAARAQRDGGADDLAPAPAVDAAVKPPEARPSVPPAAAGTASGWGRFDFARYCAWCHGKSGDDNGQGAKKFQTWATDFTTGVYKCRSTPSGTLPTDADLARSIRHGLDGSGMPSFVALGPMQVRDLVATLEWFSPRFGREPRGQPIATPPEPRDDAASVARGAAVYERMKCASCHGVHGRDGPAAANLRNQDGSPAHVTEFTRKRSLRCGETPVDLYRTLMTGLDGTPMSSYAEAITPDEAWDLVHYLVKLRQ
jgi:mono/diheme cytochrome c family protein